MKIEFFDFDGCLINSPLPETGKPEYLKKTGTPYPHEGWWGRAESLNLDVFDIQPFYKMDLLFKKAAQDPDSRVVLLTNRRGKLEKHIRAILDKHNYKFDIYNLQNSNEDKGQRLRKIIDQNFPNATSAVFYDDDPKHLRDARNAMKGHSVPLTLYIVERGEIRLF